jgi:hypothetical protein
VSEEALAAALPASVGFRPVAAGGGSLLLEASTTVFGVRTRVRARLSARNGALVIAPEGLLAGIGTLTVYRDPRIEVTGVGATETPGGYEFTATARLRD